MAGVRNLGEASEVDYETQFSTLVEQEVERRLFQVSVTKRRKCAKLCKTTF